MLRCSPQDISGQGWLFAWPGVGTCVLYQFIAFLLWTMRALRSTKLVALVADEAERPDHAAPAELEAPPNPSGEISSDWL